MKDSIKRLQKFIDETPSFKLEAIGMTMWRSHNNAMVKIFGRIDNWNGCENSQTTKLIYLDLVIPLFKISSCPEFNFKTRTDAEGLLIKFTHFETILVAMLFLQIFKITTPLSDYLQTKNLDFVQAWRLIETSHLKLKELCDKFDETLQAARTFVSVMTRNLDESAERDESLESICIESELKEKRQKKVKKLPGEVAGHENIENVGHTPEDGFRISTFYCVIDTLNNTMESRFLQHKTCT